MDREGLTQCLGEVMMAINGEARLASPATVERCLERISEGPGMDWLVDTAHAWGLTDADEVRQHALAYRDILRTEQGQEELKQYLAARRAQVENLRRWMVRVIRLFSPGSPGVEFQCGELPDNGGIYGLLSQERTKKAQGGEREKGIHHNQG
jgi:hypothetical protein